MEPADAPQTPPPDELESADKGEEVELGEESAETNNPDTDKAVEDIIRKEGDEVLEAEDASSAQAVVMKLGAKERFKNFWVDWWGSPAKRWGTIAAFVAILAAVFLVPLTRYDLLGLYFRENITVVASDSKTGAPVSGAEVTIGSETAETDAAGKASLYVHAGSRYVSVTKKYYDGAHQKVLVTLSPSHNVYFEQLVPLGREVKVTVDNTVTGSPVADAIVTAAGAEAKTNSEGTADVELPSGTTTQSASVSLSGYNTATVTIAAGGTLTQNTFKVTPAGQVYFLSDLDGTIDVVKTNLDGTDQQMVLSGTGDEDPQNTVLLASSDWKYLALLSRRSGSTASLYLIDTTKGDKLSSISQSNATFKPIGWLGDKFIYEVDQSATVADWQSGQQQLESFDPTTGQSLLLDQSQGSGTGQSDWMQQAFDSIYLMGGKVVYTKGWNAGSSSQLSSQQAELDTIQSDGSNHQVIKTFMLASGEASASLGVGSEQAEPNELYLRFNDGTGDNFYVYQNGSVSTDTTLTDSMFADATYPTYLVSPSGDNTFWSESQNGQNTLFVGDENGNNQKQLMSLSSFTPYDWYTGSYLLVTKNGELYIMSVNGGTPFLVSNSFESASGDM